MFNSSVIYGLKPFPEIDVSILGCYTNEDIPIL